MVIGILAHFDDGELARDFGRVTLDRGRDYAAAGRVSGVEVNEAHGRLATVTARVEGTSTYAVTVTLVEDRTGPWLDSRCTCPVGRLCKHAAAAVLVARESSGGAARAWEHRLGLVLEELEDAAEAVTRTRRPLALQVELPPARSHTARSGVRLRPVQRGARDNWVKSGVSWGDLSGLVWRDEHDPAQVELLTEMLASHRASTRQSYYSADAYLSLTSFGPALWSLLPAVEAAGIALVPAGLLRSVRVHPEPVTLRLDVNGADASTVHLRFGVELDGVWFTGEELEVLGSTGHGVALWTRADERWDLVLARLARPAGPHTRRLLAETGTMTVPSRDSETLVEDYLPRLHRHLPVSSSDASLRLPEVAEPRLALTVTWKAVDEVHLAWSWRYAAGEDDRIYALDERRGLRGVRRPDREAEIVAALDLTEEQVYRLFGAHRRDHGLVAEQTFTGMQAVAFVEDTLVPLEESGQIEIEEIGPRPDYREATEDPVIRFAPRSSEGDTPDRTDWLDLEVIITIGSRSLGLATLLEALTLGQERLILRDGTHLRLDRPEFTRLTELVREARELQEQPSDGVRLGGHDLGLWDELAEIGLVDAQASQWVQAAQALRGLETLPHVEPVGLEAELRGYQAEGFRWLAFLWQARLGGILADDMGLGKTLQTLALIAHARDRARAGEAPDGGDGPFLVLAPSSVVHAWVTEAAAFTPELTVRAVTESRTRRGLPLAEVHAGADVVVTSYTLFRLEADDYVGLAWGGLVLDEAQTVKNHQGKTHQAVRRIEVPFRLALSGTPLENRLMELWSLLSIVAPGLYPYPQRFTELVANPIEKEGDAQALARFNRRIRPFLLRRTKENVAADLPPKQEQVLEVRLTPKHRRIYDLHLQRERQQVLGLLGDFDRQRVAIFRSLTRLRQLSLDAGLLDAEYDAIGSAKVDALVDHLHEIVAEGHRALVFSQFTSFLTRVRRRLDAEGITSQYLDGRTRRRGEVVAGFKGGQGAVFLISLKAGGTGLTLTEADYVFVLDPWWNPAVEAQAVDRAHRIGQHRPVIVYRLVAADTIEEKVMELKARKAALFAKVVDGEGGTGSLITADDIRGLFED